MKKIITILMLFIAYLTMSAQCPIAKPSFSIKRLSGNSFMFINTTVIDTAYTAVYTWTFGDGHFIINPNSDTVTNVYTNTYMLADSVNQYVVELGVEIYKNDTEICNPYVYDTVKIAICKPVIIALPNDSFANGTVLDNLQLNNAQIVPEFAWSVNNGLLTFEYTMAGFKPTGLHNGDSIRLIEFLSDNSIADDTGGFFSTILCSAEVYYVVVDTTTGISPVENNSAELYLYNNVLTVKSETLIKRVQVYNTIGQLVYELNTGDLELKTSLPSQLVSGIYIVSVTDANERITSKKVFVQ